MNSIVKPAKHCGLKPFDVNLHNVDFSDAKFFKYRIATPDLQFYRSGISQVLCVKKRTHSGIRSHPWVVIQHIVLLSESEGHQLDVPNFVQRDLRFNLLLKRRIRLEGNHLIGDPRQKCCVMSNVAADIESEDSTSILRPDGIDALSQKGQFRHSRGSIAKHHPIDIVRQVATIPFAKEVDFKEKMRTANGREKKSQKPILSARYPSPVPQPSNKPQAKREIRFRYILGRLAMLKP